MCHCLQKYVSFCAITINLGIALFFIFPFGLFANDNLPPIPDSISQKIAEARTDTARLKAIYEKCVWTREYRNDIAESAYLAAVSEAERVNDTLWISKIESGLGVYYSFHLQYDKCLLHYYKALGLLETIHNTKEIAGIYHNIGMVLTRTKENDKAIVFFQKAAKMNQALGNKAWLIKNYGEIGGVYKDWNKYDSAVFYYKKAMLMAEEIKNNRSIVTTKCNLGNLYINNKQYTAAEPLLRDAYLLTRKHNFPPYNQSHTAMLLGDLLQGMGKLEEAEKYLKEAISIKEQSHIFEQLDYCYDIYSELEEKRGNYQLALTYYKKYRNMHDSVLSDEKQKALSEYEIKYESQKKEKENIILKKDNQIKQQQIYSLSALILLLAAFIGYYYYSYRQKKKANELISAQKQDLSLKNQQLSHLLDEKDNIIATVSHDYRSPLGRLRAISELLLLNSANLTQNQQKHLLKIPEILKEATHLIDDLMDVSHLDKLSLDLREEDFHPIEVLELIVENYQTWIDKKQLTIQKEFPQSSLQIHTDKAAFHRIFDNLISNAIKYTFANTHITIKITTTEATCSFWVQDEGQGFSAADKKKLFTRFQRLSAQPIEVGTSYGLGLSIIKKLTESMGASIKLEESEKGACFCWEIPLDKLPSSPNT